MLRVDNVTVRYGDRDALYKVDLRALPGNVTAVLGPSGSGKTTLLRVIAGLEVPDAGTVSWEGRDLAGVPTHQRNFGLMFQDFALFPHLDVGDNVAFGLRMRGHDSTQRVGEMLELVGLAGFEDRPVHTLSGGEQQRVALARTLAPQPELVMLDEPLGSLDRSLREELVGDMRGIFVEVGVAVLYVTHDQDEAFGIADHIVVMNSGTVADSGPPDALWSRPTDLFTARFLGFRPIVPATVANGVLDAGFVSVPVEAEDGDYIAAFAPGALFEDGSGALAAGVLSTRFRAGLVVADVEVGGQTVTVHVESRADPGTPLRLGLDAGKVALFPKTSDL